MPPKKKKGKGKKKKGKKKEGDDELKVEDMYKRSVQEVDSLKERLAERKAYARHSRMAEEHMRVRMLSAKKMVEDEKETKKDIATDLTRQYKTMQYQLETQTEYLKAQVGRLQENLEKTTEELKEVKADRNKIQVEWKDKVYHLEAKLQSMEKSYEAILHDAFDALAVKMDTSRQKWDMESYLIEKEALDIVSEFGKELRPSTSLFRSPV